MDKDELKIYLKDNPQYIKDILEYIGCHHVKIIRNKYVQSARPDGDNPTSINIKLNDFLSVKIWTKAEFEKSEGNDFYSLIQFIKGCEFEEALSIAYRICNIELNKTFKKKIKSNSYEFLKKYKRALDKEETLEEYSELVLPEEYTERFVKCPHEVYLKDGVSIETQIKFGVSYDVLDNRIVIPIRNEEGKLLTFKGRYANDDYKKYGIPKFIYYYPFKGEYYLYGLYENYFDILNSDIIYVFESEKAVKQCDSMGINSCISVNKKVISDIQVKKILKLGKPIVISFDKDVPIEEIYIQCKKFRGLIDVYYIYDTLDVLKGKESPTDRGIEGFSRLIGECLFKYKGE